MGEDEPHEVQWSAVVKGAQKLRSDWPESSFAGEAWRSRWTPHWPGASNAPWWQGRPVSSQAVLARLKWLRPSALQLWDNRGMLYPLSASIVQERCLTLWSKSSRGQPRGWSTSCVRSWESWICSGKRRQGEGKTCCLQTLSRTLLGIVCWKCKRLQTQAEKWEILT